MIRSVNNHKNVRFDQNAYLITIRLNLGSHILKPSVEKDLRSLPREVVNPLNSRQFFLKNDRASSVPKHHSRIKDVPQDPFVSDDVRQRA